MDEAFWNEKRGGESATRGDRRISTSSDTCRGLEIFFAGEVKMKHAVGLRKPRSTTTGILFTILAAFIILSFLFALYSLRHPVLRLEDAAKFGTEPEIFKVGDPTLGGLLLPPEEYALAQQCVSRSEEHLIRNPSPYLPSSYLITKLRKYEDRHRRCAPKAANISQNGSNSKEELGDCQFIIWIANSGLGNRMITIISAFVYALLTDRVLLLDHSGTDFKGLYCEPFPGSSWLLPENFDYGWINDMTWENKHKLGTYLNSTGTTQTIPNPIPNNYIFVNLMHDYDDYDKRFFCHKVQTQLRSVPLLYWRSNNYAVPGLHFDREFHRELDLMFPQRDTVFHHMVRYLFRPSNLMWGSILRFRQAYVSGAHRQVGLQVRILESTVTAAVVADQLLACVLEKKVLPNRTSTPEDTLHSPKRDTTAVIVASLDATYYNKFRSYYSELPAEGEDYIGVHAPSKEEYQEYGFDHDKKAWADMYLLSLSDTLVTSPWSTFGYIAHGLAGSIPWILTKSPSAETALETFQAQGHCNRGASLEPCFHAPPKLDCEGHGIGRDPKTVLPFIKPCEDVVGGVKIMPSFANDRTTQAVAS